MYLNVIEIPTHHSDVFPLTFKNNLSGPHQQKFVVNLSGLFGTGIVSHGITASLLLLVPASSGFIVTLVARIPPSVHSSLPFFTLPLVKFFFLLPMADTHQERGFTSSQIWEGRDGSVNLVLLSLSVSLSF